MKFVVQWGVVIEAASAEEAAKAAFKLMADPMQRGKGVSVCDELGNELGQFDMYHLNQPATPSAG